MKKVSLIAIVIIFSVFLISCSDNITKIEVEEAIKKGFPEKTTNYELTFEILEQEKLEENIYSVKVEIETIDGKSEVYSLIINNSEKPIIEAYDY